MDFTLLSAHPPRRPLTNSAKLRLITVERTNGGSGFHPEYGAKFCAASGLDPDRYPIEAVLDEPVQPID
jgi:hypothetical protein